VNQRGRQWWREYQRYLASRKWRAVRQAALRRDRYRCQRCGTRGSRGNPLQADHISYDTYNAFGYTRLKDLRTLCKRCHEKKTGRRFGYGDRRSFRRFVDQIVGWIVIATIVASLIHFC
jgi:5-methylcytosine-specific restriction endonuclease McrA